MMELIEQRLTEHLRLVQKVQRSRKLLKEIALAGAMMKVALVAGHKIMFSATAAAQRMPSTGPRKLSAVFKKSAGACRR